MIAISWDGDDDEGKGKGEVEVEGDPWYDLTGQSIDFCLFEGSFKISETLNPIVTLALVPLASSILSTDMILLNNLMVDPVDCQWNISIINKLKLETLSEVWRQETMIRC